MTILCSRRNYNPNRGSIICAVGIRQLSKHRSERVLCDAFPLSELDMLFLQNLRAIVLSINNAAPVRVALEPADDFGLVAMRRFDGSVSHFLFSRFNAVVPSALNRPPNRLQSHVNVQLAFPLDDTTASSKL